MASPDNRQNISLKKQLLTNPRRFNFFKAVQLLQDLAEKEGKSFRITPNVSLSFPAAEVESIQEDEKNYSLKTSFFSLVTSDSPLPLFYVERILHEMVDDETTIKAFLDIFHHHFYHKLYQIWAHFNINYRIYQKNERHLRTIIYNTAGLGIAKENTLIEKQPELLQYLPLFMSGNRNLLSLNVLLKCYFSLEIKLETLYRATCFMAESQFFHLGENNSRLGDNTYLGEQFETRKGNILIKIKNLSDADFQSFLPANKNHQKLKQIVSEYLQTPIFYFCQLERNPEEVIPCKLGVREYSNLGADTWLGSSGAMKKKLSLTFRL